MSGRWSAFERSVVGIESTVGGRHRISGRWSTLNQRSVVGIESAVGDRH